ncbi:peptide ABC transporter ATP-binding protein, partial [Vibrio sp. Vb2362]|nr:peptide ABC transporter ATP-binding protein [Vibrio sp. Vb2362]MDW1813622.1 peptide ABC transporter ATP-binding protein [Vibrio sp. Vb2362]
MHEGEVVEFGETNQVLTHPEHPITQRLVESHFYKAPSHQTK